MPELTTVDEATLFVQGVLSGVSPRGEQLDAQSRFIGVGQITWLGVMDREDVNATSFRSTIWLRRGVGVREDRRCSSSPGKRQTDPLFQYLLPNVTSIGLGEVWLVAEEDDAYRQRDAQAQGVKPNLAPGSQGENIRLCGLDLAQVPFGSTLYVIQPEGGGGLVPLSLYVTGSQTNTLTLKVRSSRNLSDPLRLSWFLAAFIGTI